MRSALILFIFIFASFVHAGDYDPNATRNQRPGVQRRASRTAVNRAVSIRATGAPAVLAMPNTPLNGTAALPNTSLLPPNSRLATSLPPVNGPQGQVPLVQIPGANGVPVLVPADAATSPAALQTYVATHPYMAGRIPLMNRYNPCPAPGTPCNYLVPGSGIATQQMAPQSAMPMGGFPGFGGAAGTPNYYNNLYTPGTNASPYNSSPAYNNAPVNSGPDGLCSQQGLFQTTKQSELGDRSPCDVILDTILKDPCTAAYADQLGQQEPEGMEEFCPGFSTIKNDPVKRALALQTLAAAIVKTESGWRRLDTGDVGGRSKGYFQLTTSTDRLHGCSCSNLRDEFDQIQNLQCGTQMIVSFMAKDHTVGKGSGNGSRGIARSFGPFRDGRGERSDIIRRTSAWCRASFENGNRTPANTGADK